MLTIAGGIILAILFLVFLEPIIKLVGSLVGILIVGIVIVISLYFAINNLEIAAIFIPISIAIYYFYQKKEKKKLIIDELKKEDEKKENDLKNEVENKVNELFVQLEVKDKLSKLFRYSGELLLSSPNDKNFNREREILLENYTFIFYFDYEEEKFSLKFINNLSFQKMEFNKKFEQFIPFKYLPKNLSIDDVFNLNSDLDNYLKHNIYQEIEKTSNSKIDGTNFFEDAKNVYQKNNNTIYIFQHLISENGIEIYTPIQCKEKIEANAIFDFNNLNNLNVKIEIENIKVAQIRIKKWNELRKNQKIKFKSEFIES
jgi:hypothetical protein